jgi:hypothetical protein
VAIVAQRRVLPSVLLPIARWRAASMHIQVRGSVQPQRYRGVHAVGHTGRYRATLSIGGHYRVLGLFDTPEEAVQARDEAIIRLGLPDIARLNNP